MADSTVIAFVGDSLTAAGDWAAWFPDDQVVNLGVGGDTSDDLLARLDDVIAADPDVVVVLIGTNDLAWRKSAEHIVRNIETMLVTVRRELPGALILLQSVLPRAAEYAADIREINRHLWQFAPTVKAQWLDLWPDLADETGSLDAALSEDHLHLNGDGYAVWLDALRPALVALRETPPVTRAISIPTSEFDRPPKPDATA